MAESGDVSVNPKWKEFSALLKELFELDKRELDFGIYRVMNLKRKEIEGYLDKGLRKQAEDVIKASVGSKRGELEAQLQTTVVQLASAGVNPDSVPKVQQLKAELAKMEDPASLQERLYGHLATFFSRYWDDGDFATKRRYGKDVYAVPYGGQETLLWWANADQYYIKTAEVFTDWAFRIAGGKSVRFVLRQSEGEALTEQNNDKPQGKSRLFALQDSSAIEVEGEVMTVPFVYRLFDKEVRQAALVKEAAEAIAKAVQERHLEFMGVLESCPVESNPDRTLLQKQLESYTARNTADYFIHKNLRGFLKRELEWYVKNEVLFIEDIDPQSKLSIEDGLALSNAIKAVGLKIIDFLSELEDFQKRLWLKKKFVLSCQWCVTVDRVPRALWGEVTKCKKQREAWVRLFAIDGIKGDMMRAGYSEPLTVAFLEQNPQLVVDTALFDEGFKRRLLEGMEDIDGGTGGTLVHSDNFHALMLLGERYAGRVKCIYIDPPYNTGGDGFVYKDSYQHSTWLTMMENRIRLARELLADDGAIFISIDDNEQARLKTLCDAIFGEENFVGEITVVGNPRGRDYGGIARMHDYILCYGKTSSPLINLIKDENGDFNMHDKYGGFELRELRNRNIRFNIDNRPNLYYPFYINTSNKDENGLFEISLEPHDYWIPLFPAESQGIKTVWRWGKEKSLANLNINIKAKAMNKGGYMIVEKYRESKQMARSVWWDKDANTEKGTLLLKEMLGEKNFNYPKPVEMIMRIVEMGDTLDSGSLVLDFFGGSGTTAHAVINLNREDGGDRKWVVVEAAPYFDAVTKSRIMKAMYSDSWSGGVPSRTGGVSGCFKVMSLEQYEDTLENLVFDEPPKSLSIDMQEAGEQNYTSRHMMRAETRAHLGYEAMLSHPFKAHMRARSGEAMKETCVDVVETFNYLLGLAVHKVSFPREDLQLVEGECAGESTLVVWRDETSVSEEELRAYFKDTYGVAVLKGFRRIYVNGDTTLGSLLGKAAASRVTLTQEAFTRLMFANA